MPSIQGRTYYFSEHVTYSERTLQHICWEAAGLSWLRQPYKGFPHMYQGASVFLTVFIVVQGLDQKPHCDVRHYEE